MKKILNICALLLSIMLVAVQMILALILRNFWGEKICWDWFQEEEMNSPLEKKETVIAPDNKPK